MRSLRHDLFERHLWPLAIVIIAAIVAVPFVLHAHRAHTAIPAPPAATTTRATTTTTTTTHAAHPSTPPPATPTSHSRDPFLAANVPTKAATHSSKSTKSATPATTTSAAAAGSGGGGSSSGAAAASASATATTPAPTVTTPTVTAPTVTTPVTTTPSGTPSTGSVVTHRWDIYSVDLRVGAPGSAVARSNLELLTPLPSERNPQMMFMGVTGHGRKAGFGLGAGVVVTRLSGARSAGAACHPTLNDCAVLLVPAGKAVRLSYVGTNGTQHTLYLAVTGIRTRVTESSATAKAANARQSALGLCDLKLGDPLGFYDPTRGTMEPVSTAACRRKSLAVPFPGTLGAGSSERG